VFTPIAMQQAPGATPVGSAIAGNFQAGQCLEVQVMLNPGKCYTAIGLGLPNEEVDVQLAPNVPAGVPAPAFAEDQTTGPNAVLGGGQNCFKWAAPVPMPAKLILRVSNGQGIAAAQLYER